MTRRFYRLYAGHCSEAAAKFFKLRNRYRANALEFLTSYETTSCLIEHGKMIAIKRESGRPVPLGWIMHNESFIKPDFRTAIGRKAAKRMNMLIEPTQETVIHELAKAGLITPGDMAISVCLRSYKDCYYVAIDYNDQEPSLTTSQLPNGIMEVTEDEFNGPSETTDSRTS